MAKVNLEKIKKLRKLAGYSLEEMSKFLGYESTNGYYYLECGRGKISAESLAQIAHILKVDIKELFFEIKIAKMATSESASTA
ncbi:helix-turn-helix domain-containing protein [Paenibacillus sp. LMG 31461]|uniref:Helix-turn-helix domain-containing protein n=1 Tax=Paenibacillus plantarum TaxID=2654975 RepID=A0ABX1XKC2_9BACL|nr:helix-turn-helix domain-containing protein [Paenibacillus plantarum]